MKKLSQLSPLEKRILAAESVGWEVPLDENGNYYFDGDYSDEKLIPAPRYSNRDYEPILGYPPNHDKRKDACFTRIPKVESLDEVRFYEKHLTEKECYIYEGAIAKLQDLNDTGWFSQKCIFASAEQRLGAYLVVKGAAILGQKYE